DAPDPSAAIPLLVGYTRVELSSMAFDATLETQTVADATARIERLFPNGIGTALLAEYQRQYPKATSQFLYAVIAAMGGLADGAIGQMEDRARQQNGTPAYGYRFDWNPAIHDGRLGAFHSLEIAFAFDNTDRWDSATGGGTRAQT